MDRLQTQIDFDELVNVKVDIGEGKKGVWKISRFIVDDEGAAMHNLSEAMNCRYRHIAPGTYTKLTRNNEIIMSDTPAEQADHRVFLSHAKGDVLLNGLGLGWVVEVLLRIPKVKSITVIEISQDLIDLVAPHYCAKDFNHKLNIICANALTWKAPKGRRYNAVWNDIWDNICSDNLKDMHTLHRKYGRRSDWVGSWCRTECEQRANEEKELSARLKKFRAGRSNNSS